MKDMKLEHPRTIKLLWAGGLFVLLIIVIIEAFIGHHAHFERDGITIDTVPEFFPIYGFTACLVLVIVSKTLSIALKRKDSYYADD